MEISTFKVKVQKAVEEILGSGYTVELREVQKNNGVLLQGLMIRKEGENMSPTIYLNSFWEAYESGITFSDIIQKIVSIYRQNGSGKKMDVSFFRDFEKVKKRLCFRLVNREKNRELLDKSPYLPFLDLAICFYYAFEDAEVKQGMIPIRNSHLQLWEVTAQDLLQCALENMPGLFPFETIPMENVMEDVLAGLPEEERQDILQRVSMLIMTTSRKNYGACCILYPGVLEQIAEQVQGDFYLIPSSVHEFLMMPKETEQGEEELKEMITETNSLELSPEEVLSDHLYLYCREEKELKML